MLTGPNHVFDFVCQQTGRCCQSAWKVELTHYDAVNLIAQSRGTALEAQVDRDVVSDAHEDGAEDFQRTYHLRKSDCGGCAFLEGSRCGIHGALGPLALPDPCRNFPVIATQTAWGVEVGYNLTCPHAIALTAKSPFAMDRREWDRPLDPQQSRASFIPPPEGWRAWRASRTAAIAALDAVAGHAGAEPDALTAAVADAMGHLSKSAWQASDVVRFCDDLALSDRIAVSYAECAPFLGTWGPPLSSPPAWATFAEGLAAVGDDVSLPARYLQHTLHTAYFRTGLGGERASLWALAAFGTVLRLTPAMAIAYPKAPVRAAIVLTEMGLFGDLRTLGDTPLPK